MEYLKLEDCCEILDSKRIPVTANKRRNGKYPYYGANGLQDYVDDYIFDDELVLLAEDGGNFNSKDKPIAYRVSGKCWVNNHAHVLKPKQGISVDYLCYALMYYDVSGLVNGATRQKLTQATMRKMKIPILSEIDQLRIVEIMNSIQELKNDYRSILHKLDVLIKARFIEMFGDLKSNEKDWDLKTFEEMSVLITDGEHSTPKRTKEGIYLLSARNVLNHSLQLEDVDYINRDEYLRIAKRVVPKKGDILISCSGTIGRCCSIPDSLQLQMVRSVALIRFKEVINPIFAEYMITSDYLQEQINSSKTMSSQANLFQGKIRKLKGFLPPTELQQQFADFVQQVDKSRFDIKKSITELEREVVYD